MKKTFIMSAFLALAALFVMPTNVLEAQRMKTWTWKRYNLRFELPANWVVKVNNARMFIAKGPDQVTIKIEPYLSRRATARTAANRGLSTYSVIKNKRVRGRRTIPRGSSGLDRYIIFGEGRTNRSNSPAEFGIIGLVNPNSTVTLYARFWWYKKYSYKYSAVTYKIAKSFRKAR